MPRKKAVLVLDPDRRDEQLAFITERVDAIHPFGNALWVSIAEDLADRLAQQGIWVQFQETADLIELPAILFNPESGEPNPPASLTAQPPTGDRTAYYLVQFFAPPDLDWMSAIEELGGLYVQDLPIHVAVFQLTATQAESVRELEFVSWVGLYHPAYALSHRLAGQEDPFTIANLSTLQIDPSALISTETGTIELLFFDDVDLTEITSAVTATGATIVTETGYSLIVNASANQITDLLKIPGLRVIEPYAAGELDNQRSGIIIGANQIRHIPPGSTTPIADFLVNLDGSGEIVGVIDSGVDAGGPPAAMHPDLAGRILQINNLNGGANPTADATPHGTHVVGSILGNGTQSGGTIRGMAPASQLIFHSLRQTGVAGGLNFNNYMAGLTTAHQGGARVHSNSWHFRTFAGNIYTTADSSVLDQFAWFNPESLLVFAAGNAEADLNNNGTLDMRQLTAQGVAKNVLCIGACENVTNTDGTNQTYRQILNNRYNAAAFNALAGAPPVAGDFPISDNADEVALFSGRGRVGDAALPAARRRIKPDLVAPGTNITSTGPVAMLPFPAGNVRRPNTVPVNDYYLDSGTSMATPIAAGAAILTRQFYRTRFGQLRRPLLLEQVSQFGDRVAIAAHRNGVVMAWIRHDGGQNHIVGAVYSRNATQRGETALVRQGNIVQLQANVGDRPAIAVAQQGDNTVLLHRASDNTLKLSLYDVALAPVASFGSNGVVSLTPASRNEPTRNPALFVRRDEIVVVWHQTGSDNLLFQRLRGDTGATIGTAQTLGSATATASQPYIANNFSEYAVVWVVQEGSNYKLQILKVDNAGTLVGTQPTTLITQAQEIRDACIIDDIGAGFLVAWVNVTGTATGDELMRLMLNPDLSVDQPAQAITPAATPILGAPVPPPARSIRQLFLAQHPDLFTGFVLGWEDNTQLVQDNTGAWNPRFDVYLTFLDLHGNLDHRISGDRLRLSDTPEDTQGFAAWVTRDGSFVIWQSADEGNSDLSGVYALKVTVQGAFQAQVDPNVPLLDSGRYVRQVLHTYDHPDFPTVGMIWAGGDYFLVRAVSDGITGQLQLLRTHGDGLVDDTFGGTGTRELDRDISYDHVTISWANPHILLAHTFGITVKVFLLDGTGAPINTFGTQGARDLAEPAAPTISPQVAETGSGNNFRVLLAYGRFGNPNHTLRYVRLRSDGTIDGAIRDLAPATGTARYGWFHWVPSDTPSRSIAAWHLLVGGQLQVQINRFALNGTPQHASPIVLTSLAGDSQTAVIAPRPVLFGFSVPVSAATALRRRQREYGVAWVYRPNNASPWEIRFSRLNRNGTIAAVHDVQVVSNAATHATEPQLIWHSDGYALAWLEQPIAGGVHTLMLTVLDENGVRVNLAAVGNPPAPAPNHVLSTPGADVQQFQLVWNGRSLRVTWTELLNGSLRQMQTAIAVPRQAGVVGYDQPYHHPSAALIRATLINGATNLRQTSLPNLSNDPRDGYGWGRINLRQSLVPVPPVTFQVRDDSAIASGQTVRYTFSLPPNTRLLRVTLCWTDPPSNRIVNNLNLRMTVRSSGQVYVGNRWQAAPNAHLSDPLPAPPPANPFETIHTTEQIVLQNPAAGLYDVEVIGGAFAASEFLQFPGQPFALVFVGSGDEVRFGGIPVNLAASFY